MSKFIKVFFLLLPLFSLNSCSLLRASPLKETYFLPKPEVVKENRGRAPFNAYWVADELAYDEIKKSYQKVYIENVDIENVRKMYESASGSEDTKIARIEEAEQLASYFREKLRLALLMRGGGAPKVVDKPDKNTLNVNLALTQLVPTNPGVNFAGTVAGFVLPGGGLISYFGQGSIAMEGYVDKREVDAEVLNSTLYEQYKDREGQKTYPFSLKDYQRYAHLRVALDDWAMQIAELLSTDASVTVEDSAVVSLNPL